MMTNKANNLMKFVLQQQSVVFIPFTLYTNLTIPEVCIYLPIFFYFSSTNNYASTYTWFHLCTVFSFYMVLTNQMFESTVRIHKPLKIAFDRFLAEPSECFTKFRSTICNAHGTFENVQETLQRSTVFYGIFLEGMKTV